MRDCVIYHSTSVLLYSGKCSLQSVKCWYMVTVLIVTSLHGNRSLVGLFHIQLNEAKFSYWLGLSDGVISIVITVIIIPCCRTFF